MRKAVQSWAMKMILAIIILSFVSFYGFQAGQKALSPSIAAEVNGEPVLRAEFDLRFQSMVNMYEQYGLLRPETRDLMLKNLESTTLNALVEENVKANAARDLGLAVSPKELQSRILSMFDSDESKFDFETYKMILQRRLGMTPGKFEESQGKVQLAQLFDELLARTSFVTDEELRMSYTHQNSKVDLAYINVPESEFGRFVKLETPKQEDLETYFKENEGQYLREEKRKLQIYQMDVSTLAKPSEQDLLDLMKKKFEGQEEAAKNFRLHAAHILIQFQEGDKEEKRQKAMTLLERIQKGESFESLARKESDDPSRNAGGDLGYFGKGDMVPAFEKAALLLGKNEVSKVVESEFGFHIIKLYDKVEAGDFTLDRLRPELAYEWTRETFQNRQSSQKYFDDATSILNEFKGLPENKKKDYMEKNQITSLTTDFLDTKSTIETVPDDAQLIRSAQTLEPGSFGNPVRGFWSKNIYLIKVVEVDPAKAPPFAEVRDLVEADYTKKQKKEKAIEHFKMLLREAKDKKQSANQLANQLRLVSQESGLFPSSAKNEIPGLGAIEGSMQKVRGTEAGNWIEDPFSSQEGIHLFYVKEKVLPDWKKYEDEKETLRAVANEDVARRKREAWLDKLCDEANVKTMISAVGLRCQAKKAA